MAGIPSISIEFTGIWSDPDVAEKCAPATPDEISALHMLYIQHVRGDQRKQFLLLPPAEAKYGKTEQDEDSSLTTDSRVLVISRLQNFVGNRSKWHHSSMFRKDAFLLLTRPDDGFNVDLTCNDGAGIVVPLALDDYLKFWGGETAHKAFRAVGRSLTPYGLTVE